MFEVIALCNRFTAIFFPVNMHLISSGVQGNVRENPDKIKKMQKKNSLTLHFECIFPSKNACHRKNDGRHRGPMTGLNMNGEHFTVSLFPCLICSVVSRLCVCVFFPRDPTQYVQYSHCDRDPLTVAKEQNASSRAHIRTIFFRCTCTWIELNCIAQCIVSVPSANSRQPPRVCVSLFVWAYESMYMLDGSYECTSPICIFQWYWLLLLFSLLLGHDFVTLFFFSESAPFTTSNSVRATASRVWLLLWVAK